MQKLFGEDVVLYHGPQKHRTRKDSNLLSFGPHVDIYFPPRKRSRVTAPFIFSTKTFKKHTTTIDDLPDECLFEIFRRVSVNNQEKSSCASVSKRWLNLLSTIRKDEIFATKSVGEEEDHFGYLKRCLKGKKATDIRLAAIGVGLSNRGGLGELVVFGNADSKVTDFGLKAVARGCSSSLRSLTLCNLSSIGDDGLVEIANECNNLEKIHLSHCPKLSDKSLIAITKNCPKLKCLSIESCLEIGNEGLQAFGQTCVDLKSVSIKNCALITDQAIAGLVSSTSRTLTKLNLENLSIGDMSLAVVGHYGLSLVDLSLTGLDHVTEKGFWVMGNGQGLQKLTFFKVNSCSGVTDRGVEAVSKGCPNLKEFSVKKSGFLTDNGIVSVANSGISLEKMVLEECHGISQIGIFGFLANSAKLESFSLTKCFGVKDSPIKIPSSFPRCESLKSLTISNCPGFGNFSLALLGSVCNRLQRVALTGLDRITDTGFASFVQNREPGLTVVDLSGCVNVSDKLVSAISQVHGGTIEAMNLDGCQSITDSSVVEIARNCSLLQELDVSRSAITDFAIAALARDSPNLKILSVSGCCRVSNKSVPLLKKLGETLVGLNIMKCGGITGNGVGFLEGQIWNCDIVV